MLRRLAVAIALATLGGSGCSDPVPPLARGSLFVQVTSALDKPPGYACNSTTGHQTNIGSPAPDATNPGGRVEDGEGGTSVSCKVSGSETFTFNGRFQSEAVKLTIAGTVQSGGTGETNTFSYRDQKVNLNAGNTGDPVCDVPCTISVSVPNGNLQVAKGRIWAQFSCPRLCGGVNEACGANGYFVLENCDE